MRTFLPFIVAAVVMISILAGAWWANEQHNHDDDINGSGGVA